MKRMLRGAASAVLLAGASQAQIHVTTCGDAGAGSLREAIVMANASAGPDDIVFDLSCSVIHVSSNLPAITDSGTRILGETAPDDHAGPDVILESAGATHGLTISGASDCVIQGIRVQAFPGWGFGIVNGGTNNRVGGTGPREEVVAADNLIGLRMAGVGTANNTAYNGEYFGGSGVGVALVEGASANRVGGLGAQQANAIYNNFQWGVRIETMSAPVIGNIVEGNRIGTDFAGATGLGNVEDGVRIVGDCSLNELRGNLIVHNGEHGVYVQASGNLIGPDNAIGGNALDGVHIGPGSTVQGNVVLQNHIGLDASGLVPVPNGGSGVVVRDGASQNEILDNVVSANTLSGIQFYGNDPFDNLIQGNWIGVDAAGASAQPNQLHGVHFGSVASENTIRSNVISGNLEHGILLEECACELNVVEDNLIGTLPDGTTPLGNGLSGMYVASDANLLGSPGHGNTICANGGWGIEARSPACGGMPTPITDNVVAGNRIGVALDDSAQPNGAGGVLLGDGVIGNQVGDTSGSPGGGNEIRHNAGPGVQVGEAGAIDVPTGNRILTNGMGQNTGPGIRLVFGGNELLPAPPITAVSASQVDGTNPLAGCGADTLVQVFTTLGDEGETFLGEVVVPSADATWTLLAAVPSGTSVVATATSLCYSAADEQTSGFSAPMTLSVGTPYCFGDGSGAPCPCGNTGGSGEGCAHGLGQGALLAGSGSASVGADDLVLEGSQLVPGQPGLYFQGDNQVAGGSGLAFGDGLRCAGGSVRRIEVRPASASGVSSTTVSIVTAGAVTAGDTKHYQLWYRTPGASACGFNFNLSPGLRITWTP